MDQVWNNLWLIWLIGMPIYFRLLYDIVKNQKSLINGDVNYVFHSPFIIFQITTKGGQKIVQESVNNINEICSSYGYKEYKIDVISEREDKIDNANVIVVPEDFHPKKARFKARALQYAIEFREKLQENTSSYWIFHMDDESMLTKQCLVSLIKHIENNGNLISEGLIIYPNKWETGSRLVKYLDSVRPVFCYECTSMLSKKNRSPDWLHGSNLLVRADIEKSIGWDFYTVSEDTLFGHKAFQKYGKEIFGWHGGVISEQSPFSFGDFIKQRKRWIIGTTMNFHYLGRKEKFLAAYSLFSWGSGMFSFFVLILSFFIQQQVGVFKVVLLFNFLLLVCAYQIGFRLNTLTLKLSRFQRVKEHLFVAALTPFLLLLESLPVWAYLKSHSVGFDVIEK